MTYETKEIKIKSGHGKKRNLVVAFELINYRARNG